MDQDIKELKNMTSIAIDAAKIAGKRALAEITSAHASIKNGNEIVTQMDPLCQQLIIDHIMKSYPEHGILAEEGENGAIYKQSPKCDSDVWWVIDPIDGTNNYAHQILSFTVSIAVMKDGLPIVGVIYYPATDITFATYKDSKTLVGGKIATVSDEEVGEYAHISIDSHWPNGIPANVKSLMEKVKFRNFGTTALHLAYLANGSLIACLTNTTKLWDIAAGALLIQNAGGKVGDWDGKPIFPVNITDYKRDEYKLFAANQVAYDQILNIISENQ